LPRPDSQSLPMRHLLRWGALGALWCLLCSGSLASSPSVDLIAKRTIAPGDSSATSFTIPESASRDLALELDARMQSKSFAGSNLVLRILVNATPLTRDRLLDKPATFATANGKLLTWADADRWRVVYSPDFDPKWNAAGDPHQVLGVSPYHLLLRVGDLLRPGANRLVLQHLDSRLAPVEVASVRLTPSPAAATARSSGTQARGETSVLVKNDNVQFSMQARPLSSGGGVDLALPSRGSVPVETRISIPGGGWRRLGRKSEGWSHLQVSSDRLRAQAPDLEVHRSQRIAGGFLVVRDVFLNRSAADLGLIVRYLASVPSESCSTYLGGIELPPSPLELTRYEPQSPTAVAVAGGTSIGLVPGDDVLWIQASTRRDRDGVGLVDDRVCIAPRDSVALVWRALVCPGGYPDWLDRTRATLGANFTLEGGFAFGSLAMADWPQAKLRDWIHMRGLRYVSTTARVHDLHGPALLDSPEAQADLRRFAAAVHAAAPDVKVLSYFHCFLTNRKGAATQYADTRFQGPQGEPLFYPYPTHPNEYQLFVPVKGSAFARALEQLESMLWGLGFDGLYWDEMSFSVTPFTYGGRWDGVSGDIDPKTGRLLRRKSAIPLLARDWISDQVARLESEGRPLVANNEPVTTTAMRQRFPRFVETPEEAAFSCAQLWSPIGLANKEREHGGADVAARICDHLEHGVLYYFYSPNVTLEAPTLASYMFPATPVRIRPGVFEASERILTTRSGRYGWGDASGHDVHVFAADGQEIQNSFRTSEVDGARWTELSLAPGQSAAIVREPKP
jgi:hypothetical protein